MNNNFISFLIVSSLISCNQQKPKNDSKTLDFGAFTIQTPTSWQKVEQQGVDSYVGAIALDLNDTISFDLGAWSNTLTEREPVIFERSSLQYHKDLDTTQVVIVESRFERNDPDLFRKQNLVWDSIDGREAKVVYPRKPGKGITGVYIHGLRNTKTGMDHFNLYGEDLKPENEKALLEAIKSLDFR